MNKAKNLIELLVFMVMFFSIAVQASGAKNNKLPGIALSSFEMQRITGGATCSKIEDNGKDCSGGGGTVQCERELNDNGVPTGCKTAGAGCGEQNGCTGAHGQICTDTESEKDTCCDAGDLYCCTETMPNSCVDANNSCSCSGASANLDFYTRPSKVTENFDSAGNPCGCPE